MPNRKGLVAHWPLRGDCADAGPCRLDGLSYGVTFSDGSGARFDGRGAFVEVPAGPALRLGQSDFTISLWARLAPSTDDPLGDLLSKYDPRTRKGFSLGFMHHAGVTSTQANHRHLHFSMDAGSRGMGWSDCGRPGTNQMVWALCEYNGALYAGVYEPGSTAGGHVYRYRDGAWGDCGRPHRSNAVTALAEFQGKLYAGVGHYRAGGSALEESPNTYPGGRVYRYEGGKRWTDCGRLGTAEAVFGLAVCGESLYATSMYSPGLYRYEGGRRWTDCGHPGGRVGSVAVYRGHIFAGGYDADYGGVHRYDGDGRWYDCGGPPETTQSYSFAVYRGALHVGTWPSGKVFRYDGGRRWHDCGQLGDEKEVMGMAVYNGKLYAGTLPLAEVYRYDGDGRWTRTGRLDWTPEVTYRRAWSMAVHAGKLFCGTLPSGRVHSWACGQSVSVGRAIKSGWKHIAAVRRGNALRLFVNGKELAASRLSFKEALDVASRAPLRIGFGPHDYFNGTLREVRVYDRALAPRDLARLAVAR